MFKRRLVAMATAAIIGAATLPGCGDSASDTSSPAPTEDRSQVTEAESSTSDFPSEADLDAYVADAQDALQTMLPANFKEIYSSVQVQPVYPDGIEYVYTYREPVDDQAAAQLDSQLPLLKAAFRTQIAPEMKLHGWASPSATWTYLNPDGTKIWTHQVP